MARLALQWFIQLQVQAADPTEESSAVRAARDAALIARLDYERYRYRHAEATFDRQASMTWWIFAVVIALVAVGLWFSWLQFRRARSQPADVLKRSVAPQSQETQAMKLEGDRGATADVQIAAPPQGPANITTKVEIGSKGLMVESPVLGVVILALSLGFFYLYLQYVYPVTNIQQASEVGKPTP